ncbi:piercer of microtubule wall 1 protein-like [Amphiura filiformis]|uniref:piercer of microtubule wall 1 protein-like n=1 Tax=Amphiura filiformis TaxID=82378 RepID=UPI003B20BC7F
MAAAENKLTLPAPTEAETTQATTTTGHHTHEMTGHHHHEKTGEKTSEHYKTFNIPERFENPDCFEGYQNKPQHPMYTTTAMVYGAKAPTVHTMPTSFHCKSQKFSEHLGTCGMYRNQGLNTSLDQSKV